MSDKNVSRVQELFDATFPDKEEKFDIGIDRLLGIIMSGGSLPNLASKIWKGISNSDEPKELALLMFALLLLCALSFATLFFLTGFIICTFTSLIVI